MIYSFSEKRFLLCESKIETEAQWVDSDNEIFSQVFSCEINYIHKNAVSPIFDEINDEMNSIQSNFSRSTTLISIITMLKNAKSIFF